MLLDVEMSPYELYLGFSQNTHFRARFRQTSYKDLVFARGEFLSVVGTQKEPLRIILMYYMFKY